MQKMQHLISRQAPRRESLCCEIKVFLSTSVFEMFYTQFLYEFLDACRLV